MVDENTQNDKMKEKDVVNWIPYDDHRNAVEHGSGDIILLLDDEDRSEDSITDVRQLSCNCINIFVYIFLNFLNFFI